MLNASGAGSLMRGVRPLRVVHQSEPESRMNAPNISAPAPQPNFPIMPEAFWAKFSTTLQQQWKPEVDGWWFGPNNRPQRTKFMTAVLTDLARDFGCHCE